MKILMLNPPFLPRFSRFSRSPAVTRSGTIYYPLWHAYATGLLEREGHRVMLLDAPAEGLGADECYRIAKGFSPDITVVYTSTPSIYNDVEIAGGIKDIQPKGVIVLTGPHVSALPEESLELDKRVDIVARGEYDLTIAGIAKAIEEGEGLESVKGITWRSSSGITSNPGRAFIEDLDSLPFVSMVYKKHLKVENYFYAHCRYPAVSIFTSRGCNAQCSYCVYPQQMFGRKQRQRSPESIVAEFEYIEKELPRVKEVLIDDDTFSSDQSHTMQFCELMIKKGIRVPWTAECRANLKYETMAMMKRAGCRLIVVGFESADNTVLKNMKKGLSIDRMRLFAFEARRAGIMLHACFMAGNKGDTIGTLMESLRFAREVNADTCQFFPLMVYPGTESYDWAKKSGYLKEKDFSRWLTPDGLHNCVVSTPELSAKDAVDFCGYARRKYYLGPGYLSRKLLQMIKSPGELKKTVKSAKTFAKYLLKAN